MSQALLLPLLEGITAGLIVAAGFFFVYSRTQKKAATGVLAEARADAARIRSEATQGVEHARAEAVLAAKLEAVQVRESLEQELLRAAGRGRAARAAGRGAEPGAGAAPGRARHAAA